MEVRARVETQHIKEAASCQRGHNLQPSPSVPRLGCDWTVEADLLFLRFCSAPINKHVLFKGYNYQQGYKSIYQVGHYGLLTTRITGTLSTHQQNTFQRTLAF